ncbi:hypothetical protein [Rhodococcus maanshanensis]|uniref:Large secreted protein n=1 Tax=Rhodococcus maanshanensis TaxID=183556 RepID=A0A1H7NHS1_9NOCA|nr:hypothetical protein [Rhodococcus maanshanensis]SEL22565.1 hypothetical protein SAMN05444583_10716 [Rhodococcus maanshanensis]
MRILAVAALLSLALAGCSDGDASDPATAPSSPAVTTQAPIVAVTSPAPPPVNDPDAEPGMVFTADPTIVEAHPTPFESYTVVGETGDRVAVHFTAGAPECYGADATVTESASSVTIALRTGTRADAVDRVCVMIAVQATLEVQLAAPLGNRQVISG